MACIRRRAGSQRPRHLMGRKGTRLLKLHLQRQQGRRLSRWPPVRGLTRWAAACLLRAPQHVASVSRAFCADAVLDLLQDSIVLDPYAHGVVSRAHFGQLGQVRSAAKPVAQTRSAPHDIAC